MHTWPAKMLLMDLFNGLVSSASFLTLSQENIINLGGKKSSDIWSVYIIVLSDIFLSWNLGFRWRKSEESRYAQKY